MTVRIDDKQQIEREIKRLEIEYEVFLEAYQYEIYSAVFQLAIDNPDMLLAKLREVRAE